MRHFLREVFLRGASLSERRRGRADNGFGGERGAAHHVDLRALALNDFLRDVLQGGVGNALCFLLVDHFDVRDLAVLNRNGNLDRGVASVSFAFVHTVSDSRRGCHRIRCGNRHHKSCGGGEMKFHIALLCLPVLRQTGLTIRQQFYQISPISNTKVLDISDYEQR